MRLDGWTGRGAGWAIDAYRSEISDHVDFHKHSQRFPPCSAGRPELRSALSLLDFASKLRSPPCRRAVRASAGERFSMDDEARATGLDPVPDRAPGPRRGRRSPYRHPRHDEAARTGRYVRPDLCRARSRHQQLPAAGGARDPRQLPRHRCVLAHHPAGRGRHRLGPAERSGDRARGRGVARVPQQDAQPRRHPRAADRDRSVPRGRERRRFPRPRARRRSASSSRSSIAKPRRGSPPPAARR